MESVGFGNLIYHRGNYLVRRLQLRPGQATPWHRDPCNRVSVVLSGDELGVEFRDGGESHSETIQAGEVYWLEPSDRIHRAVNVGKQVFEEITIFFMDRPNAVPQPEEEALELSTGLPGRAKPAC